MSSEQLQSAHFNQSINFIFKAQLSQFKYRKLSCYPNKFKSTRYEFYSRAQVVEIHTVCGCPCLVALCLDFQNQNSQFPKMCLPLWFMVLLLFIVRIRKVVGMCCHCCLSHPDSEDRYLLFFSFWCLFKIVKNIFINCIGVTHGLLSHSVYPYLCCCCSSL